MKITVIRTNGTEEVVETSKHGAISRITQLIGASGLDTVNLRDGRVMLVDDTGMVDGREVNPKATALYHAICKPGTVWSIHGDVAIAIDEDFA